MWLGLGKNLRHLARFWGQNNRVRFGKRLWSLIRQDNMYLYASPFGEKFTSPPCRKGWTPAFGCNRKDIWCAGNENRLERPCFCQCPFLCLHLQKNLSILNRTWSKWICFVALLAAFNLARSHTRQTLIAIKVSEPFDKCESIDHPHAAPVSHYLLNCKMYDCYGAAIPGCMFKNDGRTERKKKV